MINSHLLLNEYPLMVLPELAVKIGLNESIVLQQIHYWLVQHEKQQIDYHDGRYWVYNSYPEWNKQFPFWSDKTLRSIFQHLENIKLVLAGNYNKIQMDRTKWYSIDYNRLESLCSSHMVNITGCIRQELPDQYQRLSVPETTNNDNGSFSSENRTVFDNEDVVNAIKTYMKDLYVQRTHKKHPYLKPEQAKRIYKSISDFANDSGLDYQGIIDLMLAYLNTKHMKTDWNINHFATEGIMMNRMYETM